ncbi:MAG: hypothetical protein ACJAS1_004182 [Oleiphilaceae bacterium]|jgi:hypothetical protein
MMSPYIVNRSYFETIKQKVGNYKSELGVNNPSNSSEATKFIAENFRQYEYLKG